MAEWGSNQSLSTRMAHLSGALAGGLNGPFVLNGTTVHDNGLADNRTAGRGADLVRDLVQNRKSSAPLANITGW